APTVLSTQHFLIYLSSLSNDTATTEIYTLSLHDALPICPDNWRTTATIASSPEPAAWTTRTSPGRTGRRVAPGVADPEGAPGVRSEEHTSELQSRFDLVCRLLLEKKKKKCLWDTALIRRC